MTILVTDAGFTPDNWTGGFEGPQVADLHEAPLPEALRLRLFAGLTGLRMVRIELRHFGDTEALALARALRRAGYGGRLRAHGAVLARDYTLLRRAGFDEVELDYDQARLQPPEHWHNQTDWQPRRGDTGLRV